LKDDWDFYPCRVDDAPGSIFLNLALAHQLGVLEEDTLYAVAIRMAECDAHGMGSADEAEVLHPVEDALVSALTAQGLCFVGRLRNHGLWQVTFMGPPDHEPHVERLAGAHLDPLPRSFSIVAKHDPEWTYYSDFLFPNEERMRWIQDRRVVDALQREGDPLTASRRVDHWIYFPDSESQAAFVSAAAEAGFQALEPRGTAPDFAVQVHRIDAVQLESIHEVTTFLADLAARFDGDYDGWETEVEAEPR